MRKIVAALLLLVLTFSLLAGCGKSEENNAGTSQTNQTSQGTVKKEPVSLRFFIVENAGRVPYRNDFPVVLELGKRTNTKIEFQTVPNANLKDKFTLAASSGDMPDVMIGYREDINKFGPTGSFVALDGYIDTIAPNIKKFYDSDPSFRKYQKASDGKLYTIPKWTCYISATANFVRKDWLDKLGLKVPETIDEFVNVLREFKAKDPNGNKKDDEIPYSTRGENTLYTMMTFVNPFGITDDWYVPKFTVENKKVIYGPIDPRYKDALTLMGKLYTEGLIDKEFVTMDDKSFDAKLANNQIGSVNYWISYTADLNNTLTNTIPGFEWAAVPPLKGPGGDKMYNANDKLQAGFNAAITVKNKYPEETIKLFDYMFSDEGKQLLSWGIEGTDYKMADGKHVFTDLILNNPQYKDRVDAMFNEGLYMPWPHLYDPAFLDQMSDDPYPNEIRTMYNSKMGETLPPLELSKEEMEEVTKIMADVTTYKQEMVVKFIMGKEPIEKFDSYVAEIKKMNIDRVLEIYGKAYQKFMNG